MKRALSIVALAFLLTLLASLPGQSPFAGSVEAAGNSISIQPIPDQPLGADGNLIVSARMTNYAGRPVGGARLRLLIDNIQVTSGVTDGSGSAQLKFRPQIGPGGHRATVIFDGSKLLGAAAAASRTFTVLPAEDSTMTLDPLPALQLGQDPAVSVTAHLKTSSGKPVGGERLMLKVDGVTSGSGVTDETGTAVLRFRTPLDVGSHKVEVSFDGTQGIHASSGTATLVVSPPSGTVVTVDPVAPLHVGDEGIISVTAHLADTAGRPVPNARLQLYIEGESIQGSTTDGSGTVLLKFRRVFAAGSYNANVKFEGSRLLAGSDFPLTITVLPSTLTVQVIPAMAGARILAEGKIFTSGDDGVITIELSKVGAATIEALPFDSPKPGMQLKFSRWSDEVFTPQRDVLVPLTARLQLGFDTSYQVGLGYVDPDGNQVPLSRITSAKLSSSVGSTHTFKPGEKQWLQASRIIRAAGGLEETRLLYSLDSVIIDGSNVVNAKEQRFYLEPNLVFESKLLLYDARIVSQDAIFGTPIGKTVVLEYPDGHKESHELGANGILDLTGLPRGQYRVSIQAPGFMFTQPVALSRSQDVGLKVISYVDLAAVIALLGSLAIGLLLVGRPYLARVHLPAVAFPFRRRPTPQEQ